MAGHIIHKQTFNIGVATDNQAHDTGNMVRDAYVKKVLPALDHVFSALSPDDQVYRFDRIEIDLGTLPVENLDSELPDRMTKLIEEAVAESIEHSSFHPPESGKMKVIPVSASLFDAFVYYLEHGILPWWFSEQDTKPDELFAEIPGTLHEQQIKKLKQTFKLEKARTRLAQQFSDDFVSGILGAMQTTGTNWPETEDGQEPVLFSEFLSGMINTLEKLRVPIKITADFRMEMMREMLYHKLALSHFPLEFDPEKTEKALRDFIASSVNILIKALALNGVEAEDIISILNRIRELLSEKSIPGFWFSRQTFSTKQIEEIILKTPKQDNEKSVLEDKDETFDQEEKPYADDTGIYIKNAGAVLLWPFLKNYFDKVGLLAGDKFKSTEEQNRAVVLLQHAISGDDEFAEYLLPLNKIMCGMPVDEPLKTGLKISAKEKAESETMIRSAIETWKAIGKVSVEGLRESFLKREGRLKLTSNGWSLKVERKTIDILLDKLPWMISMVKLKWMKQMIYVDW